MNSFEKKILSTICALSMAMSSVGAVNVLAEEKYNYSIGNITIGGSELTGGEEMSIEDIKTAIASLGEITLAIYTEKKDDVIEIAKSINLLSDEQKQELEVSMSEEEESDTYWKRIKDATFVVEAGPVYDMMVALPDAKEISTDNYKDYYSKVFKIENVYNELSANAQKKLAETSQPYNWSAAKDIIKTFDSNDRAACVEAMEKVVTDASKITSDNYIDCVQTLNNAKSSYDLLIEEQKEDVNAALEEAKYPNAEDLLSAGIVAVSTFEGTTMDKIRSLVAYDSITFDNCEVVNADATEAKREYDIVKDFGGVFVDTDLEEKIKDYIASSKYFIDADNLKDTFESASYVTDKNAIDEMNARYDALSVQQQAIAEKAKDRVDEVLVKWTEFRQSLINEAIDAIDAIPEFDSETCENQDTQDPQNEWTKVVKAINDAETKINDVAEIDRTDITNIEIYKTKKADYESIKTNYNAELNVINLINAIGTVGNLPSDAVNLESKEKIEAARGAYDSLTVEQKDMNLIKSDLSKLESAEAEFKELKAAEKEINDYIKDYDSLLKNNAYDYDKIPSKEEFDAANEIYKSACDKAYDTESYGTKLKLLITAEFVKTHDVFVKFYNASTELNNAGNDLETTVDAFFNTIGITDINSNKSEIETAIIEYTADNPSGLEALKVKYDAAGAAKGQYDSKKNIADSVAEMLNSDTINNVPTNKEPYKTYEDYADQYMLAAEVFETINPSEVQEKVVSWAKDVNNLFNQGETEGYVQGILEQYQKIDEEKNNFTDAEQAYVVRNHGDALSQYMYLTERIEQYKEADAFIKSVNNTATELENIDALRKDAEDTNYINKLYELQANYVKDNDTYNKVMTQAVKDIAGVNEAYDACVETGKEIDNRKTAYEFDCKAAMLSYTRPDSDFASVQEEKFTSLWNEYTLFSDKEQSYVITYDYLIQKEAGLVMEAIASIGHVTDYNNSYGLAVKDANICYEKMYAGKDLVENYAELEVYTKSDEFVEKAYSLAVNEDNYTEYVDTINNLYTWYSDWTADDANSAPENANNAVDAAYSALNMTSTDIVGFMIADLNTPDDIRAMTEIEQLTIVKSQLDDIDMAYKNLPTKDKLKVKGYSRYTLGSEAYYEAMQTYNKNIAASVDALISAIGYKDENNNTTMTYENYLDYRDAISEAQSAFDSLDEVQKNFVTLKIILDEASRDFEKWTTAESEAQDVKAKLADITDEITKETYEEARKELDEAVAAYASLSDEAKNFVTAEELIRKEELNTKIKFVEEYMSVVERIDTELVNSKVYDKILNGSAIDVEYAAVISDIEKAYNELSIDQKLCVDNYVVLSEAKKAYNKNVDAAIETIKNEIDAIEIDSIRKNKETEEKLTRIQGLIDLLSDEKVKEIDEESLNKLADAWERYNILKTPEEVCGMIDSLGRIDDLTEENYNDKKEAVAASEEAFNLLSAEEKVKVTNYASLEEWRKAIDSFTVDHSGDINLDGVVDINDIYTMVQFALEKAIPTDEEFERANIVKETGVEEECIDIYDILAAIDLIEF